ncbi:MAG: tyrosine--tRNA ligase, partial [Candidatus Curtissbacteria bacterium]|nr:tyrosine--tRNA ligase [Candidatus Curtissbacteria bacterium]
MDKIDELLNRGVEQVLPNRDGLAKLMNQKKITLYLGIDPSNAQIHLGNAVPLRKLRQFQDLGHKVILLIGDFTGMIGDPTDKSATRPKLTHEQVLRNAKTYKEQASKILAFDGKNPAQIKFNSEWLAKLNFEEILELSSLLTLQQIEERDMFVKRKQEGKPIHLHEFWYPLMQGYDSVAMDVDLEVGGTDQTFNMLVGRQLMKSLKNKEKFVMTVPLLLGTDGSKMGKSTGNYIAIDDKPNDMFGKIMSIRDDLIKQYFELTTDKDLESIDWKQNPMQLKKQLASEIVAIYHGRDNAKSAQKDFENTFQKGAIPQNAQISAKAGTSLIDAISEVTDSKSQSKRLLDQGAIEIDGV